MTSRLLSERGAKAKKTWVERIIGGVENRVLGVYGRYLWFFLRYRWISAVIWFVCLLGTGYLFYSAPKSFLPVGDSSFIRGVLVAQEGSSPEQMHAYQDAAEKVMHGNPAVASTFTMSGNGQFLPSNQAFLLAFLKDPAERAPRSEEHTSELQSRLHLVCRLLLEKKKKQYTPRSKDTSRRDLHETAITPTVTRRCN